jgi:hypothetical protein
VAWDKFSSLCFKKISLAAATAIGGAKADIISTTGLTIVSPPTNVGADL